MIGAVILAAGAGTRFGQAPKLLADLCGRPVLEHSIAAVCAVPECERIIVVLGANATVLLGAIQFERAEPLICEDWSDGMSASLKCGVAALGSVERALLTLGDMPRLTSAAVRRLLACDPPARAVYDGRPGHPVLLGPRELAAVSSLDGDRGARALLTSAAAVECSDLGSGRDVDTVADLDRIVPE